MKSLAFFLSLVATCFSLSPGLDIDRSSGLLPFGTLGVKFVGIQTTYGMGAPFVLHSLLPATCQPMYC